MVWAGLRRAVRSERLERKTSDAVMTLLRGSEWIASSESTAAAWSGQGCWCGAVAVCCRPMSQLLLDPIAEGQRMSHMALF
jgi:hypothetical protein